MPEDSLPDRPPASEQLVITLHVPRRAALMFAASSVVFPLGSAVWIALSRSWPSIILGGFTIAAFTWVWWTRFAARRAAGTATAQIVATKEGLASPLWRLDWNRVRRVWIGLSGSGGPQALNIEPIDPEDIKWSPTKTLRFNRRVSDLTNMPAIQILQVNVDRPLEELVADFERLARRPLEGHS